MHKRDIYITQLDLERLKMLVAEVRSEGRNSAYLGDLEEELDRAVIVEPEEIPPDVITMNSRVCLKDLDTGEKMTFHLVFPQDADIERGRISVLAPIGTAMIGYGVGETVEWEVPAGTRKLEIVEIPYQPEAAGDFDL